MKKGLVSVFIPSYNYERFLADAIDSILAQTYADWELIIVDDASSDSSPEIIERYRRRYPERIRSTLLTSNVGQSESTNIGLRQAQGEFIALLAADDRARPERLARGVATLKARPTIAAAFSKVAYIDGDGRPLQLEQDIFNQPIEDLRWQLLGGNFLCGTSIVARRAAMQEVGGYNRTLGYVEDYDLWLRLLDRFELVRVDDIWVDYRLHGGNLSIARERQDVRFGTLYESVSVAIRAMHRWPIDKLHRFRAAPHSDAYRTELAELQLRLARCCLRLETDFLDQVKATGLTPPALGTAAAYPFLLDALQNDPANAAARELLAEVYGRLGDFGRAAGGKSSTLGELLSAAPTRAATGTEASSAATGDAATAATAPVPAAKPAPAADPYASWLRLFNINPAEAVQFDRLAAVGGLSARFHLALILPPGGEAQLAQSIQSLAGQSHANLLLSIVAHSDAPPGFAGERLRWLRGDGNPLAAVNETLRREDATWVGLIHCGDQLASSALTHLAEATQRHPAWRAVYTDDDAIGPDGEPHSPRLKPDFDLTLLRQTPYVDGLVLVRWDAFVAAGGFEPAADGAANYDLMLRLARQHGAPAIGHLAGPLLHCAASPPQAPEPWLGALERHLAASGGGSIGAGPLPGSWRIAYPLPEAPLVSIVIPTRDRLPMLSRCIESLFGKTSYPAYEILIVDHGSRGDDTRSFLDGLAGLGDARLRVLKPADAASLAACFNAGAAAAQGRHLLFLHDDVAALQAEWLDRLVAQAERPGIGAVGGRLLAADGRLQHAGIALGLAGAAELLGNGAALDEPGYLGRYAFSQQVSAASAACLLVRREAFEAVQGFAETDFPLFLTDVDFCLRLGKANWSIVWTPEATLLHDGPLRLAEGIRSAPLSAAERARQWSAENERLLERWLPTLARDAAYNRLHSLQPPAFRRAEDPCLVRDALPWKPLPRVLVQPADRQGCGHYRLSAPLLGLVKQGLAQGYDSQTFYTPVELERIGADTLILQRPYTSGQLDFLEQAAKFSRTRRLFDLDDLITEIPEKSAYRGSFPPDLAARLKRAAALCDALVVSTEPLAQALKSWHGDIRVVPNRLPKDDWTPWQPLRRAGPRPRVGWAGGRGHEGDLRLLVDTVKALAGEVDWVWLGYCPDYLRELIREVHAPVEIAGYPAALAGLNLDVALAPLEVNAFNEAKSPLKLLEFGALGYPVVCSDIIPYQAPFPVTRVRNRPAEWTAAIRALALDPARAAAEGETLRQYVLANGLLEDHLDGWRQAWLG